MANAQATQSTKDNASATAKPAAVTGNPSLRPKGLDKYKHVNPELAGWFIADKDTWISGVVMGTKTSVDADKTVKARKKDADAKDVLRVQYLIKVTAPCKVSRPGAEKGDTDTAKVGEIIALDHRDGYKQLAEYEPEDKHVHIHFVDKVDIGGGQTFWRVELFEISVREMDDLPF